MKLPEKKPAQMTIDEDAVEAFASQAETERQKAPAKPKARPTEKKVDPAKPRATRKKMSATDKVIRDSFTIPEHDRDMIPKLINKLMRSGVLLNKSELLRAGLYALNDMKIADIKEVASKVEKVKVGRPKE